ncbi:MAG: SMP-30/gluconolactonase/LRE family protein [Deltaproteobacteria bacterium]|nr:SMP-30/gluconolactonase/LRE family protein [Candidatus Zymogenaceae bacterium]
MNEKEKRGSAYKIFPIMVMLISLGFIFGCAQNIKTEIAIDGCMRISGIPGPEDFAYLEKEEILIVSSHDRRNRESDGELFWIDLTLPPEEQVGNPIAIEYPEDFRPHGISYLPTPDGGILYVISHPMSEEVQHTIEIFGLTEESGSMQWEHLETITSDLLTSPNDLVVLPDNTLLISNDSGPGGDTIKKIRGLFHIKSGSVVYYNGSTFIDLGVPESYGNGINYIIENGEMYIYRAALMNRSIKKFQIDRVDGEIAALTYISKIKLDSMPDNLEVDGEGNMYTAAHFNSFLFLAHAKDRSHISPTQVYKITPQGEVTELYANRGEGISAGSVARVINGRLYIGQVFEDFILSCPCSEEE